jgi:2-amino-4-hydroxy-6-hydroxymethyldihydropteridine diphosphokinase
LDPISSLALLISRQLAAASSASTLELKSIERALGRPPTQERNSPRTIDIDLLYCDDIALSEPSLTIPHPQIARRRFVLQPLADIRPELILPRLTKNVQELLSELKDDEIVKKYCGLIY